VAGSAVAGSAAVDLRTREGERAVSFEGHR